MDEGALAHTPAAAVEDASAAAATAAADAAEVVVEDDPVLALGEALGAEVYQALQALLFGRAPEPQDVLRWHQQGFRFSANEQIPFVLTQLYGGPCGILAPLQAMVVKHLLYPGKGPQAAEKDKPLQTFPGTASPLRPSPSEAQAALLNALVQVLCRARSPGQEARGEPLRWLWCCAGNEAAGELRLRQVTFASGEELKAHVQQHTEKHPELLLRNTAVVVFVMSVVLTRGVEAVKADMDDIESPLVARFGHCTQELVNLMLTGRAVSNVFDGKKVLDGGYEMKGIEARAEIGYLTLLEAMRYGEVGRNYKQPSVPIWVIGSQSHYTILFALDPQVGAVSEEQKETQKMRQVFNELDPEENGFIPSAQLGVLLQKLGVQQLDAQTALTRIDPQGMGICLWHNVSQALREHKQSLAQQAKGVRPPANVAWSCSACTFRNSGARSKCEMCGTDRPPERLAPRKLEQAGGAGPSQFELFHVNGLDGHGKCVAECKRVEVTLLGEGVVQPPDSMAKRGLRDVIHTRFPDAVVEFQSPEDPKI